MNSITIIFPIPSPKLAQNGRSHWREKARLTKLSRHSAKYLALSACALMGARPPRWEKSKAKVHAFWPTMNFPDPMNLLERAKSLIDGIQDAGIIADDKGLCPDRPVIEKDAKNPRIEITITHEPNIGPILSALRRQPINQKRNVKTTSEKTRTSCVVLYQPSPESNTHADCLQCVCQQRGFCLQWQRTSNQ